LVEVVVEETSNDTFDALKLCLEHFSSNFDEHEIISNVNRMRESDLEMFNENINVDSHKKPKLDLKPFPENLKYAYLGADQTLPVIIASDLIKDQEERVLKIIRENKEALGWVIADIKGICPSICEHHLHLIDEAKPSREVQQRLNPNMREVVKEEIIKCLDNNIIYPISNST